MPWGVDVSVQCKDLGKLPSGEAELRQYMLDVVAPEILSELRQVKGVLAGGEAAVGVRAAPNIDFIDRDCSVTTTVKYTP